MSENTSRFQTADQTSTSPSLSEDVPIDQTDVNEERTVLTEYTYFVGDILHASIGPKQLKTVAFQWHTVCRRTLAEKVVVWVGMMS